MKKKIIDIFFSEIVIKRDNKVDDFFSFIAS